MPNYCIYLRKSRADYEAELHGEGETLARHEKTLTDLARRKKLDISAIYREVVSGETISSRPEMQKLLSEVEQNIWDGVLVMEVERLARGDTIDQGIVSQTFKYSNTKIITPAKIYDPRNEFDEEYFEFGLFMSRREYKTINRRLQSGRLASVNEGNYLGSIPPYGYKKIKLEYKKGYSLEIEPSQSEIVRLIFNLYVNGLQNDTGIQERLGISKICGYLNRNHIPSAKGGIWVNSSVQGILSNPVYIGKIRWNARKIIKVMENGTLKKSRPRAKEGDYILIDGIHKPIIDTEIFEKAQEYRKNNTALPIQKNNKITNPLSGIVTCGICGRKMVRRPCTNKSQSDTLMCTIPSCKNISSKLKLVEEKILLMLKEWLAQYKINWKIEKLKPILGINIETNEILLNKLTIEKATIEKQLDNIYNLLEQGLYDTKKFLERSNILTKKIENINKSILNLQTELSKKNTEKKSQDNRIPKVEKILELYYKTNSIYAKNKLLKNIIDKVVYTKNINTRWHGDPNDFEIILYPKIPK